MPAHVFVPMLDAWIGTVLTVCFVTLLLALAADSHGISSRLQSMFAPAGSRAAQDVAMSQVTAGEKWRSALYIVLQSVAAAALYMSWRAVQHPSGFCGVYLSLLGTAVTPVIMLTACSATYGAAMLLRRAIYQWMHATFFQREARLRWRMTYRLSLAAEAVILILGACMTTAAEIDTKSVVWGAILSVVLVKLVLLWCAWQLFFGKKRATLHFFAYLCSAELIPLAILWQLLQTLTLNLTV